MANELLYGLTPQDYARAFELDYNNEQFNALGPEGTRNALRNNIKYQPAVAAPQATAASEFSKPQYKSPVPVPETMVMDTVPVQNTGSLPTDQAYQASQITDINAIAPATSTFNYKNPDGSFNADMFQAGTADQRKVAMDTIETQGLVDEMNRANEFDWMGAAGVGIQGANLAMNIGMYSDKKDYYENVNKGLEQNLTNAQDTHDNRAKQQTNLGSTFSRN